MLKRYIKNKGFIFFQMLIILFCMQFLTSCSNSVNPSVVFPPTNVSFQSHVYPFLVNTCSYQGCHSDETQAGGRAITTYNTLYETANLGLVIANDSTHSQLYLLVAGKMFHQTYVPLSVTQNQINGIRQWIMEGAKNN